MIYLDFNATTPVDPEVLEVMIPLFSQNFGNASSVQHAFGMVASELIENARGQIAKLVGARSASVVFTSGSTEAINLGIRGVLPAALPGKKRILVAATEHKAVLESAYLGAQEHGLIVEEIPVLRDGMISLEVLSKLMSDDVALVAVMHVNNETGVINPIKLLSEIAHKNEAIFFSDLTQSVGKVEVDIQTLGIDLGVCSSHKIYGPKGVGALFGDKRIMKSLAPLIVGGGHESGLRSGTQNVPGIAGFGAAAHIARTRLVENQNKMINLRKHFLNKLDSTIQSSAINSLDADCVANTINLWVEGADANAVMTAMPNVCVSSGSACQSAVPAPSHVLIAMGVDRTAASESLRFSFGNITSTSDLDRAVDELTRAVQHVRSTEGFVMSA
jgi:cysteine desulfurase